MREGLILRQFLLGQISLEGHMARPAQVHIDISALQHNLQRVRDYAPNSKILAMVKANAYGHGLLTCTKALAAADAFGLACINSAVKLREAGCTKKIVLICGYFTREDLALISKYNLDFVVHHPEQLNLLKDFTSSKTLNVWLKINTGMNRLGLDPADFDAVVADLQKLDSINIECIMTHFAASNDQNNTSIQNQVDIFHSTIAANNSYPISLVSSAGTINCPELHNDWVRPGIMLYGVSPFANLSTVELGLQAVMSFTTKLISIYRCQAGDAVGYSGTWVCPEEMMVGIAAIGYGDGYPRHVPSGTPILVNETRSAVIGRVSMDLIAIDLRACPDAVIGSDVELWGKNLPVAEVAAHAETISYELLSQITARVSRTETV